MLIYTLFKIINKAETNFFWSFFFSVLQSPSDFYGMD